MLRNVEQALIPAQRQLVIMALTRLAAHFWNDRGEAQWKIVWDDYANDLAEYPADIVGDGIREYRQSAKWWPKIAELIEIMRPKLLKRRLQLAQLQKLLEVRPDTSREKERERLKAILGDSWSDWWSIPLERRFADTAEAFAAGWQSSQDKPAFCAAWGVGGEAA